MECAVFQLLRLHLCLLLLRSKSTELLLIYEYLVHVYCAAVKPFVAANLLDHTCSGESPFQIGYTYTPPYFLSAASFLLMLEIEGVKAAVAAAAVE